jgi:integrase
VRNSRIKNLADVLAGAPQHQATELTFAELSDAYCSQHLDNSDTRLRKWVNAFGQISAWHLPSDRLEAASQAMIQAGYAPSTVNRDLSNIGSLYKWAKKKRLSPPGFKSPTLGIQRFEEAIRRVHVEQELIERLRTRAVATRDRRFGCFVSLLIDTGARKSELLERRWSEVDLERREILAPTTKNGTPRVLFFSERTEKLLRRVYGSSTPQSLIFEGRVPGQPIEFRRAWSLLVREIGQADLRMHDIRHVAAANLLRSGTTLGVAAQVLGHDPAVLARRYGHLETATLRRAQEMSWMAVENQKA